MLDRDFDSLLDDVAPADNAGVAFDLASRGFAVFPICDWSNDGEWKPIKGFLTEASADTATVANWWRRWPNARVGLLCGERNGLAVLDLDTKNGKDGVASLAELGFADLAAMSPFRVRTPSGGWHLYYSHDRRLKNWVSKIAPGIDVKTTRGYVIAPGSFKAGVCYETDGILNLDALPNFPDALVPPPEQERPLVEPVLQATERQRHWGAEKLLTMADGVAAAPDGERNDTLNKAAMWAGGAGAHGFLTRAQAEEALTDAGQRAGMAVSEIRGTFKSGWRGGLKQPISDFPRVFDLDELDDLDDLPQGQEAVAPARLRFLSPGECADAPSRGYVIKGFLAPGDIACIFGAPGAGKSLLSPHLGYAVAQARTVFGMRTKPGRVFYVAAEDPHGMRGRVSALKRRHGDADSFSLVERVSDLLAENSADLKALYGAVKDQKPALIFVDTLAMSFPGLEENSAEHMGRVVAVARKLASHAAAVVLIHHDTKAGTPTPRGHSLLNGALDVAMQLTPKDETGIIRGKLTKNRNGSCDRDVAFRIATECMGEDDDGDPITFALVDELAPGSATLRPKLSSSERAALKILSDMLDLCGKGQASEAAWRDACIAGRTVSASDEIDSRKKATKRALEGLARKRAVIIQDGSAMVPGSPDSAGFEASVDLDAVDNLEP